MNILVAFFSKIRQIEVFDITNPQKYNKQISPVPWQYIKSRFHWKLNDRQKSITMEYHRLID